MHIVSAGWFYLFFVLVLVAAICLVSCSETISVGDACIACMQHCACMNSAAPHNTALICTEEFIFCMAATGYF